MKPLSVMLIGLFFSQLAISSDFQFVCESTNKKAPKVIMWGKGYGLGQDQAKVENIIFEADKGKMKETSRVVNLNAQLIATNTDIEKLVIRKKDNLSAMKYSNIETIDIRNGDSWVVFSEKKFKAFYCQIDWF